MNTFGDFYKMATVIANGALVNPKRKEMIRESTLIMCIEFAKKYEIDPQFRKEADAFLDAVK